MNTTQETAIVKLQSNPAKQTTRTFIASQAVEWVNKNNIKTIQSATLPADAWLFENTLQTITDIHSENKPEINFFCAESKPKVFNRSLKKMPLNGSLYKGNFENMVKGQVEWKSGLGYHSETLQPKPFNFIWADYCKNAKKKDAQEFASMTKSMPNNSLAYITYGVMNRRNGGQKALAKKFKGYTNGSKNIHNAVKGMTTFMVKASNRNRKVQPILDIEYGGGSRGSSTMIVLGYAIGMRPNLNSVVKNLREDKAEMNARNYSLLNRIKSGQIKSTHKGFISRVRVKKAKKIIMDKTKVKIIHFIKKGWDSYRIADKFKVTARTVGGIRAHIENPNSWK